MDKKGGKGLMLGALLGGLAGAAAGVLLAPKSGRETRLELKGKANKLAKDAKKNAAKLKKEKVDPALTKLGGEVVKAGEVLKKESTN